MARYVNFAGSPFQARKNFEGAAVRSGPWTPREGLVLEAGLRVEWNEIVRDLEAAPRFAVAWAPGFLRDTKFSAGWGIYYDAISLALSRASRTRSASRRSISPGGVPQGQCQTAFLVNERDAPSALLQHQPASAWSANCPRLLPERGIHAPRREARDLRFCRPAAGVPHSPSEASRSYLDLAQHAARPL